MDIRQYTHYMSWCNDHGITIYVVVDSSSWYKIEVNNNGKLKRGERRYKSAPSSADENWSNVVRELYKQYFEHYNKEKIAV